MKDEFGEGMDSLVFTGTIANALRSLRAVVVLALFLGITLPGIALQYAFLKLGLRYAKTFPHAYHKLVCRILGIRLRIEGRVASERPVLLVSNHVSWLDIPVLSAVAPLCFVSKAEVASWPFVSILAKLQRSVFIDRNRKTLVRDKAGEIADRLRQGDTIVLFAEGTSSDGNRILPFRTSLFSAAVGGPEAANDNGAKPAVQTITLSYTHLHGLPLLRHERAMVAWYGDMDMMSHAWQLLKAGPLDVSIKIGDPVPLAELGDRKQLAAYSEAQVRQDYVAMTTARDRAA
jgi:1-acyl-sn-glycerol-3-phosphate acyltransferase